MGQSYVGHAQKFRATHLEIPGHTRCGADLPVIAFIDTEGSTSAVCMLSE